MSELIEGNAWVFGDNVDTDAIIPATRLALPGPEHWAKHAMEGIDPKFADEVQPNDVIVAADNFGCGSSREHAPLALKAAGVGAVVADSIGRIFFRNALNSGLPALECPGISKGVQKGDRIRISLRTGQVSNLTTGGRWEFSPLPDFLLEMLTAGGLMAYYAQK